MTEVGSDWSPPYIHPYFASRVEFVPLGVFSVLLGIFVDYVIVTQSKSLGTFKYFLFNQTVWAQLLEIFMLVFNPVFLSPYMAGYMGGFIQHIGSYECTNFAATLCFIIYYNANIGVTISLVNRYISTFFPQYGHLLEKKTSLFFIAILHLSLYASAVVIFQSLATDAETIRIDARNETHGAIDAYLLEPSLIYFSLYGGKTRLVCKCIFVVLVVLSSILAANIGVFIANVIKQKKTDIISKTAKSLIVSSIMQAVLCIVMLHMPMLIIMVSLGFDVPNSANVVNIFVTLLSIHGTFDMVSTLYFIVPYRMYCLNLVPWRKKPTIVIHSWSNPHS